MSAAGGRAPGRLAGGLAYERVGTGPPVVLVHGLASSRRAWDPVVPALAEQLTVLSVDLPGHGDSTAPAAGPLPPAALAAALGRFLDDLGIDRAHLVGNSLGGWTVLEAAADGRALSVTGLAPAGLSDPIGSPTPLLKANRTLAVATGPTHPGLLRIGPLRRTLFRPAVERPESLPYRVAVDAARAQVQARGFGACLDGVRGRCFTRAGEIPPSTPVTIVFGDRDRLLPAPRFQLRRRAPDHATWQVWWRCGHAPMWDLPRVTVATVLATVAQAEGAFGAR